MSDSIILGISTGAITGTIASSQVHGDNNNAAVTGAIVGGVTAYFIHKGIQKREERVRRETLLNLEKFDVSSPSQVQSPDAPAGGGHLLTKPVVDMDWIETQVQGDKLVEGHRVWKIIEKPKWIPSSNKERQTK